MNLDSFLAEVRKMKNLSPDSHWQEQTGREIMQHCQLHPIVSVQSMVVSNFVRGWIMATVPVMVVMLAVVFTARQTKDDREFLTGTNFPSERQQGSVDPALPLATSVQFPLVSSLKELPKLAVKARSEQPKVRRARQRRPVATTRLAISVQSLPQAPWVFSEKVPGDHARWVFGEQKLNVDGS